MENVKLIYFPDNGRVGLIRAMLAYKKIPFENIMYGFEEWPSKKDDYEFKQLPPIRSKREKINPNHSYLFIFSSPIRFISKRYLSSISCRFITRLKR